MQKYLDFPFWFISGSLAPRTLIILLVLAGAVLMVGVVVYFILKKHKYDKLTKQLGERIIEMCAWMGVLLLMFVFFFSEGVYILSCKAWFLAWLIGFALWSHSIYKSSQNMKEHRERVQGQHKKDIYLHTKKKKRKRKK